MQSLFSIFAIYVTIMMKLMETLFFKLVLKTLVCAMHVSLSFILQGDSSFAATILAQ